MNDLERLVATEQTRRLMARYVHYADQQRWQDLAALFTPTGTFTLYKPDGSLWMVMSGREGIAATIAASAGKGDVFIHHLFSDEVDVQSADAAIGVFNMEDKIFRAEREPGQDPEIPAELAFTRMEGWGHYRAEFTKRDGAWSIAALTQTRLRLDFTY